MMHLIEYLIGYNYPECTLSCFIVGLEDEIQLQVNNLTRFTHCHSSSKTSKHEQHTTKMNCYETLEPTNQEPRTTGYFESYRKKKFKKKTTKLQILMDS